MIRNLQLTKAFFGSVVVAIGLLIGSQLAAAADRATIDAKASAALTSLYASSPGAKALADRSKAILVFPDVVKVGLIIGGQGGDGVLLENGMAVDYYNTAAVSVGMQAGAQSFGYVLFFMSEKVLNEFKASKNFQIGVGPSVVFIDAGAAKDINTLSGKADVYGIIFDQKGLMAGIGLQGAKITKIDR